MITYRFELGSVTEEIEFEDIDQLIEYKEYLKESQFEDALDDFECPCEEDVESDSDVDDFINLLLNIEHYKMVNQGA